MRQGELPVQALATALAQSLTAGSTLGAVEAGDTTIVVVSARPDDVLVRFRWMAYPHMLAYGLSPEGPYMPVETAVEWAGHARLLLEEELGTGLLVRATRHRRDGFIEVAGPDLPVDQRFYSDMISPDSSVGWEAIRYFERDGFNTRIPRARRKDGSLISWHRAYVNNESGSPYVGHATVVRVDADTAYLEHCDISPGTPESVALDLCLPAAHSASWSRQNGRDRNRPRRPEHLGLRIPSGAPGSGHHVPVGGPRRRGAASRFRPRLATS
ncbi:MAG: hypothetical protein HOV67_23995, partial [Kribbellaceae bacterium]|nr:hypothetical protein [Kribbellaceae bacterium]